MTWAIDKSLVSFIFEQNSELGVEIDFNKEIEYNRKNTLYSMEIGRACLGKENKRSIYRQVTLNAWRQILSQRRFLSA